MNYNQKEYEYLVYAFVIASPIGSPVVAIDVVLFSKPGTWDLKYELYLTKLNKFLVHHRVLAYKVLSNMLKIIVGKKD